mgnify:CR=1 FL=1
MGLVHLMCLRMANLAVVCGGAFEVRVPRHAGPSPPMGVFDVQVCSTSGCPHLVSSGSLCDECRKAKDKRRSRGRNPYTSKAHRLARARVLARDPRCVCPGDGPDGCGRHHGLCGAPAPSPTIGRSNESSSSKPDWTPTTRHACAACASVATTARRQERTFRLQRTKPSLIHHYRRHERMPSSRADDVQRAPQT